MTDAVPAPTDGPDRGGPGPGFRVEELSARTGAPVRTIREYQTWQVLHPPTKVGRVGFYDETHVRRLQTIARLADRGYSIAAIRDLFGAWEQGEGLRDILGVDDSLGAPADEAPLAVTAAELAELVPAIAGSPRLVNRACKVGLLVRDGDAFVARSPALLQLVADVLRAGLAATVALDLVEAVVVATDQVGATVARLLADGASDSGTDSVLPLAQRGRGLLAQAMATSTIDQVGRHLLDHAAGNPDLAQLLADIRVGSPPHRLPPR